MVQQFTFTVILFNWSYSNHGLQIHICLSPNNIPRKLKHFSLDISRSFFGARLRPCRFLILARFKQPGFCLKLYNFLIGSVGVLDKNTTAHPTQLLNQKTCFYTKPNNQKKKKKTIVVTLPYKTTNNEQILRANTKLCVFLDLNKTTLETYPFVIMCVVSFFLLICWFAINHYTENLRNPSAFHLANDS